ncbi:MAG TPA: chromate efflux transporter [Candidatus Aquilonibacter sp.]
MRKVLDVFLTFLRLGCTSFGGPVAHLAYFQREFVERRRWLDDAAFGECVALTQLLPGPASSQTGMLLGWLRAGPAGAVGAWIGFTLPSAILMAAFALALPHASVKAGWLHGLLLVAVAVVAAALVSLRNALAPDLARSLLAVAVLAIILLAPPLPIVTPLVIAGAALVGLLLPHVPATAEPKVDLHVSRSAGIVALALLGVTFVALGIWATTGSHFAILTNTLFRIGSLVFGGGHVVLPLLQTQAVAAGIVDSRTILAGYATAQAMPGPLFSIGSYVGASAWKSSLSVPGAVAGTVAIFAPSFFLLAGIAPFYRQLASNARFRAALAGANAGVVGLLAAAFVTPIFVTGVRTALDGAAALVAFAAIQYAKVPAWVMVILAALFGYLVER